MLMLRETKEEVGPAMNAFEAVAIAATLVGAAFAWFFWRLVSSARVRGVDPEWLKNFSVARYRPVERLLSEEDVEFLKSQPGYLPGMEKALRSGRRRIFRAYLRTLARDFNRLHLALRLALLESPIDRPDLATVLLQQKLTFFLALAAVHLRLGLHTLGIGTVDVRGLVSTVDRMQAELKSLRSLSAAA
jgi:hypothetical protein